MKNPFAFLVKNKLTPKQEVILLNHFMYSMHDVKFKFSNLSSAEKDIFKNQETLDKLKELCNGN